MEVSTLPCAVQDRFLLRSNIKWLIYAKGDFLEEYLGHRGGRVEDQARD